MSRVGRTTIYPRAASSWGRAAPNPTQRSNTISHTTHPSSIDLTYNKRAQLAHDLQRQLAALQDLHAQVKVAHWNVRGPFFYARHELFDAVAGRLLSVVDEIAERIGALGFSANGSARATVHHSYLRPCDPGVCHGQEHIRALVQRFGQVEQELRALIETCTLLDDPVTADLVTTVLRAIEKDLWFLESHLEPSLEQPSAMPVALPSPSESSAQIVDAITPA